MLVGPEVGRKEEWWRERLRGMLAEERQLPSLSPSLVPAPRHRKLLAAAAARSLDPAVPSPQSAAVADQARIIGGGRDSRQKCCWQEEAFQVGVSDVGRVMLECRPDSGTHMPVLCSKQCQNAVWCLLKRVTTGRVITVTMSTHARARTQYRTYHTQEQRCHHGYSLRPYTDYPPPHCGLTTQEVGCARCLAWWREHGSSGRWRLPHNRLIDIYFPKVIWSESGSRRFLHGQ